MLSLVGNAHWYLPWVILALGMYAIVRMVRGFINEAEFTASDQRLVTILGGLLDLQAALGLVYFLWSGYVGMGFPLYRFTHGTVMLVAAIIPHFSSRWRNADNPTRFINNFYLLLASFLLMLVGVSLIPAK